MVSLRKLVPDGFNSVTEEQIICFLDYVEIMREHIEKDRGKDDQKEVKIVQVTQACKYIVLHCTLILLVNYHTH